ncbi:hypothetical protein ETAA8_57440 [Anatilimnocola aggregata]|uniref:Uncharacterized protein n=1 Tax=Anatilimnocola aggregata TaxID=2528021 RepID=A0A517YK45_9BACT|nr:hypothetical protein [Anatilimnocola aggregata]QDU30598.1 hypothetical protein ETAA8_57440 [Anatilimnocola aggregata]
MAKVFEIEITGGKRNDCFHFRPIGETIRGRFDLNRETEPLARMKIVDFPEPVPGQRIGVDLEFGEGYIIEPLHEPDHVATRKRIEGRGLSIAPARRPFPGVDVSTWLFWLNRGVESGIARVSQGTMPKKLDGPVKKSFITVTKPADNTREDRFLAAMERQNELMSALLAKLSKE